MDINDEIDMQDLKYKVKELQEKNEKLQVELDTTKERLILSGVSGSFSDDDCQQLMFYGKTKNCKVKLDDGSKHLDYFLLKAFDYMKDSTIFDTENATKMFWNRIKALANYR